jgi:hypothetical protein
MRSPESALRNVRQLRGTKTRLRETTSYRTDSLEISVEHEIALPTNKEACLEGKTI